jgi:type II secretory ATPase GspE/PulE/Tfp pilus assembly ATPase PilB-like protein
MSIEHTINQWIQDAWDRGASDLHFEPVEGDRIRVRHRIDGQLRQVQTVDDGRKVVARLKVMASLNVNERGIPLDGRIKFASAQGGKSSLDLRFSSTPCVGGEKIVLRLIDNSRLNMSLSDVGFSKSMLARYKPLIESPHGLLLHVGPTGSGKTTTLYAVLQMLSSTEVNVQTVEDPVEYDVNGITQTQVNYEQGLTFPKCLRALMRQDPDIILVGEIRDEETAEIATEAALTGHLVLSTLHTNDALGTVMRLLDMGIAPYGLAYALRSVVSQRLARRLCEKCRRSVEPPQWVVKLTGSNRPVYEAEGCRTCGRDGYKGRIPIYEFLPMSGPLKGAIYKNADPSELRAVAAKSGQVSLWQDGLGKAWGGETSLEEVLRVVKGVRDVKAYAKTMAAKVRVKTGGPRTAGPRPKPAGAPSPGAARMTRNLRRQPPGK